MSIDKNLPKGISQRIDGRYMGRFEYLGEKYTLYDKDLRALKRKMSDLRYEVEHGLYAKETNITVETWYKTWIDTYKRNNVKRATIKIYDDVFAYYIKDELGNRKLKDVRSEHIQKLLNLMQAKGYACSVLANVRKVLNGMYFKAYENEMITKNPVKTTKLPKNISKEKRVLSVEEQQLFFEMAKQSQYYLLYIVGVFTGMRSGELRALTWDCIDFENKIIHVRGTLKLFIETGFYIDTPKTMRSNRDIPILDEIYDLLLEYRKEKCEYKILLEDMWRPIEGLENLVFLGRFGRPIRNDYLYKDISDIVQKIRDRGIEFDMFSMHSLRHTFATRGLENGIPPKVIQEILGHATLAMTMDTYGHVLADTKHSEMKKLSNLF